jgi:LPS O-antigen subunit length determinant protein (WzzB/FepE family)
MTENKNYTNVPQQQEEDEMEIDLMEYARKLWAARKLLLKVAGLAIIVGIVIALTTPKQYTVSVTLAPESSKSGGGGLSGIASMLGVGGFNMGSDADALNVTLYPDIVSSTPFILDLMDTPVSTIDEEQPDTTLVGYLKEYTSSSLMGTVMSLPFKAIGGIMSLFKSKEEVKTDIINPFHLTQEQSQTVNGLKKMIVANVDKKTGVTTVSVTMQDPMVAAILTDTVIVKLKEHITKYRISKAEEDCKYWEELNKVRQDDYYMKQKKYAEYVDANKNVVLQSVRIEQERLQNDMTLAYQVYSNVATQLQMAKAKVQEAKPVFAVVEPASVPLQPTGTSRKMILVGTVFLFVAAAAAWVLFGVDLWKKVKEGLSESKEENK